jgi:hypothetical protein
MDFKISNFYEKLAKKLMHWLPSLNVLGQIKIPDYVDGSISIISVTCFSDEVINLCAKQETKSCEMDVEINVQFKRVCYVL